MDTPQLAFGAARLIVIKIGSRQLIDTNGRLRRHWLQRLATDIASCHREGQQFIIVSSGAAAIGKQLLFPDQKRFRLEDRQAAAALGQPRMMDLYRSTFEQFSLQTAQILLTIEDTEDRKRHLNARATLRHLLQHSVLPIINENDTVSTEKFRYGDNDRLAARLAVMIGADLLVLLSDVAGLYTANPNTTSNSKRQQTKLIKVVRKITPALRASAAGSNSAVASGGMATKLQAATIAQNGGVGMIICAGSVQQPLLQLNDSDCLMTWFPVQVKALARRKAWIAASLHSKGNIYVDAGARRALLKGKSLLPAGVTAIAGEFRRGDAVALLDQNEDRFAIGLAGYDSDDCNKIKGKRSVQVFSELPQSARAEIIHCDDIALLTSERGI